MVSPQGTGDLGTLGVEEVPSVYSGLVPLSRSRSRAPLPSHEKSFLDVSSGRAATTSSPPVMLV